MTRRTTFTALAAAAATTLATTARAADGDAITDILKASAAEKKGVNVYVNGQTIGMLVTSLDTQYVQGRSQQFSRIVVRLSSIEAVTMS
jgi:hypothetical protein